MKTVNGSNILILIRNKYYKRESKLNELFLIIDVLLSL